MCMTYAIATRPLKIGIWYIIPPPPYLSLLVVVSQTIGQNGIVVAVPTLLLYSSRKRRYKVHCHLTT